VISIVLPKRVERRLREESERRGASEEEIVIEALLKTLSEPLNPDERVELHLKLSERYMDEAEEFLRRGSMLKHLRRRGKLHPRLLRL
jgi:hypothetical protein